MAKTKTTKKKRVQNSTASAPTAAPAGGGMYAVRETIESIVIAFVLAFLFRTFEAEAFVIPTGSMSPSLQGQHKDVCCSECGYRFRASASTEGEDLQGFLAKLRDPNLGLSDRRHYQRLALASEVMLGVCPMCRQTMAMRPDLPSDVPDYISTNDVEEHTSYPGDRILVNKYSYKSSDPERWDVVVFKFPGNGEMNYIKRLIGLPNETLRIFQGDIFIRDNEAQGDFQIERKPADKVEVMLQPVHDTNYDPSSLYNAGWPLRWQTDESTGWQVEAKAEAETVAQSYRIESDSAENQDQVSWLRYRHFVPQDYDWTIVRRFEKSGNYTGTSKQQWLNELRPELIRDFNPYNTSTLRGGASDGRVNGLIDRGWEIPEEKFGMHWVPDLAVECEVTVEKAAGDLHLDLVKAGQHFYCRIDLQSGEAQVGVAEQDAFLASASTALKSTGTYKILFANVDDQLLLWIDGKLVQLTDSTPSLEYDADQVFGGRKNALPTTSEADPGDLAPVGIGAQGASLTVHRLQVMRDIYYVATDDPRKIFDYPESSISLENGEMLPALRSLKQLFTSPAAWPRFSERQSVEFTTKTEQLFVMGDNSPQSQDCRLWAANRPHGGSYPGGPYLDRRLLIGKAVCVFWPHSWGGVPGIPRLPGFPNFGDMRLVR